MSVIDKVIGAVTNSDVINGDVNAPQAYFGKVKDSNIFIKFGSWFKSKVTSPKIEKKNLNGDDVADSAEYTTILKWKIINFERIVKECEYKSNVFEVNFKDTLLKWRIIMKPSPTADGCISLFVHLLSFQVDEIIPPFEVILKVVDSADTVVESKYLKDHDFKKDSRSGFDNFTAWRQFTEEFTVFCIISTNLAANWENITQSSGMSTLERTPTLNGLEQCLTTDFNDYQDDHNRVLQNQRTMFRAQESIRMTEICAGILKNF